MRLIPLIQSPNQSFSVRLDNTRLVMRLKEANAVMFADLERAGSPVVSGMRFIAGEPLIPYRYLEEGNFLFVTLNDELPDWRKFGTSQQLIYLTAAEIDALRALPVTFGDLANRGGGVVEYLTDEIGFILTDDDGNFLTEG